MSAISNLQQKYNGSDLTKHEYFFNIHKEHERLFEYSHFISGGDVSEIIIRPDAVFVCSKSQDIKMVLPPVDPFLTPYVLINFGKYESDELFFLKSVLLDGCNILDIGGNCGWYSLALGRYFPNAKIHAFEPIKETCDIFSRNIAINHLNNITLHPLGVSDRIDVLEFLYDPECSGATSLKIAGQPGKNLIKVPCKTTTVDAFCDANTFAPQFIKCDVEGAELLVVKGAERTIPTSKPILLLELLRKWSAKFSYHPNDVFNLLGKYGYSAYVLSSQKLLPCAEVTEETLETNFIFLHPEQHEEIIKSWVID